VRRRDFLKTSAAGFAGAVAGVGPLGSVAFGKKGAVPTISVEEIAVPPKAALALEKAHNAISSAVGRLPQPAALRLSAIEGAVERSRILVRAWSEDAKDSLGYVEALEGIDGEYRVVGAIIQAKGLVRTARIFGESHGQFVEIGQLRSSAATKTVEYEVRPGHELFETDLSAVAYALQRLLRSDGLSPCTTCWAHVAIIEGICGFMGFIMCNLIICTHFPPACSTCWVAGFLICVIGLSVGTLCTIICDPSADLPSIPMPQLQASAA